MARVVFDHVTKLYPRGAEPVVRDLSLEVEDRELMVLVGPSGCGKSTALRMIAGLESVTSGSLSIGERCVNDVAPRDRDVAMVFQSYALYPHMTCFDNMAFSLKVRGIERSEIKKRVLAAARALQVEPLLDRRPRELSGGQRQRVAIGRAIVRSPQVLLMDEPLSNLDAKLRTSMRAEVKRIHRELGTTLVYVTHDQTEAMTLGERVAVLQAGELVQLDVPQRIYDRPANVFVATFIGSPEMSLFPGELVVEAGRTVAIGFGFRAVLPCSIPVESARVLIGVRPEHLRPATEAPTARARTSDDADEVACFFGTVELVESTGTDAFVHFAGCGGRLVCKVAAADRPPVGSRFTACAHARDLHVFDAVTEGRIG